MFPASSITYFPIPSHPQILWASDGARVRSSRPPHGLHHSAAYNTSGHLPTTSIDSACATSDLHAISPLSTSLITYSSLGLFVASPLSLLDDLCALDQSHLRAYLRVNSAEYGSQANRYPAPALHLPANLERRKAKRSCRGVGNWAVTAADPSINSKLGKKEEVGLIEKETRTTGSRKRNPTRNRGR